MSQSKALARSTRESKEKLTDTGERNTALILHKKKNWTMKREQTSERAREKREGERARERWCELEGERVRETRETSRSSHIARAAREKKLEKSYNRYSMALSLSRSLFVSQLVSLSLRSLSHSISLSLALSCSVPSLSLSSALSISFSTLSSRLLLAL